MGFQTRQPRAVAPPADLEIGDTALKEVGRQVARFAYLHTSEEAQEFLRAWEGAPLNPGGRQRLSVRRDGLYSMNQVGRDSVEP